MMSIDQESTSSDSTVTLPSFSIVYETANLATVKLSNLYQSLKSLAEQDISPKQANEFLIIDGGDAPPEVIEQLSATYPWITVKAVPCTKYYEAKMLGARMTTGEIIVFCDSDCIYVSNWLRRILTLFQNNLSITIAAGETSTLIRNSYELAIALYYFFPRFSQQKSPYPSKHYFLNAVAFRRNFLMQYPLPIYTPLYRGNCALHTYFLCNFKGHDVWKHPKAQAFHEPPTPIFSFWRFLLQGRDQVIKRNIQQKVAGNIDLINYFRLQDNIKFSISQQAKGIILIILKFRILKWSRLISVLREDPRRITLLPLAFLYILWFESLYRIGSIVTYIAPALILKIHEKFDN